MRSIWFTSAVATGVDCSVRDYDGVRNEEIWNLRRAEARALMSTVGPLLSDAARHLQSAEAVEDLVGPQNLPDAILGALGDLSAASGLLDGSIRTLAVYLAEELHVARDRIAENLNVSTATLHRWVVEERKQSKEDR